MPMIHLPNPSWSCGHRHETCLIQGEGVELNLENLPITAQCPVTGKPIIGDSGTGAAPYSDFVPIDHLIAFYRMPCEVAQFN